MSGSARHTAAPFFGLPSRVGPVALGPRGMPALRREWRRNSARSVQFFSGTPRSRENSPRDRRAAVPAAFCAPLHVLPGLGNRPLQQIKPTEIDALYAGLEAKGMSVANLRHVHAAVRGCLAAAVRKGYLKQNPAALADVPRAVPPTVGQALDPAELAPASEWLQALGAVPAGRHSGAHRRAHGRVAGAPLVRSRSGRRDVRIARAIEDTAAHGRRFKPPKSKRGERTIAIDGTLLSILLRRARQVSALGRWRAGRR